MRYEVDCGEGVQISDDAARVDLERAHRWIAQSYWAAGIPWETFRRAAKRSLCAGVFDGREMVGFARVVSDQATFAWVCDVWIDEPARGRGLGKRLIAYLVGHPDLQGLRRWYLATRDAHALYARYGFQPVDPSRGMERLDPDVYTR